MVKIDFYFKNILYTKIYSQDEIEGSFYIVWNFANIMYLIGTFISWETNEIRLPLKTVVSL